MGKFLLLLLVGLVIWVLVKGLRRDPRSGPDRSTRRGGEQMVACTHCGLHLPESEAVQAQGKFFCCDEHSRLAGR